MRKIPACCLALLVVCSFVLGEPPKLKRFEKDYPLIADAQASDGFIFPYLQLYKKDYKPFSAALTRYTETYTMGHLIEMAVEQYETTGSADALKVARSVAEWKETLYRRLDPRTLDKTAPKKQ